MLDEWLERTAHTRAWLASEVGTSEVSISRIANGKQTPSLRLAVALERITGIPASRFLREDDVAA
jgi:DNA-binding XRE family transcriptional regulator